MDGNQDSKGRKISRRYEANRLEDEVWALAYEQLWPLLREALSQNDRGPQAESGRSSATLTAIARSA